MAAPKRARRPAAYLRTKTPHSKPPARSLVGWAKARNWALQQAMQLEHPVPTRAASRGLRGATSRGTRGHGAIARPHLPMATVCAPLPTLRSSAGRLGGGDHAPPMEKENFPV